MNYKQQLIKIVGEEKANEWINIVKNANQEEENKNLSLVVEEK